MKKTLFLALAVLCTQAHAAVAAFDPSTKNVGPGATFTMTVAGSGFATDLDGGGLNLTFNPAVLEVVDVLIDGTAWDFLPVKGTVDNVLGAVTGTSFNQFAHPKVGSFDILQYQFHAIGMGSSVLHLTEFADNPFASGGAVVPMTFNDGLVNIVPEPATALLFSAGVLVGVVRRRRMSRRI